VEYEERGAARKFEPQRPMILYRAISSWDRAHFSSR
jgi:hypothetical protein